MSKDYKTLYSPVGYQNFTTSPWASVSSTWTLGGAKAEIAEFGSTGFVVYPQTSSAYGAGHFAAGL